jgi:hypothetical protein
MSAVVVAVPVLVTAVTAVPIVVVVVVAVMLVLDLRRSGHDHGLRLLRLAAIPMVVRAGRPVVVVVAVAVPVARAGRRL